MQISQGIAAMGIQVACVNSGLRQFVGAEPLRGQPSVLASRRALDLLAGRTDVDSTRLAVGDSVIAPSRRAS